MNCKIIFRVDGSLEIGLGHLVRCIALAHMLKESFDIIFVCRLIPEKIINELSNNRFQLKIIDNENNFFDLLKPDFIIVLDGYDFDSTYQSRIIALSCKLVCIDDLHDKEFLADLIINHTPGTTTNDYKVQQYTQFALGPDYALLRPSFLTQIKKNRKTNNLKTVLICFGGSDYKNLTEDALKIVLCFSCIESIIVVTGSAHRCTANLKKLLLSDSRVRNYRDLDGEQMCSLMVETDLAIVPSSGILYEAICCGCALLTCFYVNNQRQFHDFFVKELGVNSFGDNRKIFQEANFYCQLKYLLSNYKFDNRIINTREKISSSKENIQHSFHMLSK